MRKRLRKKRGQGEFAGFAFGVSYVLDDVSSQRAHEFLDRFVEKAIDPHGLECRVDRLDRKWDFQVACRNGSKVTADQHITVVKWLKSRKEVARFEVEDLDE